MNQSKKIAELIRVTSHEIHSKPYLIAQSILVRFNKKMNKIKNESLDPKDINIGRILFHKNYGKVEVLGITPHCGDYKITTDFGWVYLKNCNYKKHSL